MKFSTALLSIGTLPSSKLVLVLDAGQAHPRLGEGANAAPADAQRFGLSADRQVAVSVNHRFALSNPALVSARSRKSFSSVSCPILA